MSNIAQDSPSTDDTQPIRPMPRLKRADVIVLKKTHVLMAAIAMLLLGGVTVGYLLMGGRLPLLDTLLAARIAAYPAISYVETNDPYLGPLNAPVTLVEFSDFYCAYCKVFHDQTLPSLLTKYDGKLRFIYRNFPSSGGDTAAEAADCAGDQGAYWDYHDALFSAPHSYSSVDQFTSLATSLSLNEQVFMSCLSSGKHKQALAQDYQDGLSYGVAATPTFFINGIRVAGAQPLPVFEQIIDQQLNDS